MAILSKKSAIYQCRNSPKNEGGEKVIDVERVVASQVEKLVAQQSKDDHTHQSPVPTGAPSGQGENHKDGGNRSERIADGVSDRPIIDLLGIDEGSIETPGHFCPKKGRDSNAQGDSFERGIVILFDEMTPHPPGDERNQYERYVSIQGSEDPSAGQECFCEGDLPCRLAICPVSKDCASPFASIGPLRWRGPDSIRTGYEGFFFDSPDNQY